MKTTLTRGVAVASALLIASTACAHWMGWGSMQPGHMRTDDGTVQAADRPMAMAATQTPSLKADGVNEEQMRILLDVMVLMRDMMESMKGMTVEPTNRHKMDAMMNQLDQLMIRHRTMMKDHGMNVPPVLH